MASDTACRLFWVLALLALPPVISAQPANMPDGAQEAAKSLQLEESRTLYTDDKKGVEEVTADTWLIERNRKTRDDGGCDQWVAVEYTEGLAETVQASGDPQALYFCDVNADTGEPVARSFYNFRTLLGGAASIVKDGGVLFREVKDKHRPLLESLRRDIRSGRVQPQVQVIVTGDMLESDTLTVAKRGIRILTGTKLEQSAEERRATFDWSGAGVIEEHASDYVNIPGRPETATVKASDPAESDNSFSWWPLALIGILSTLAGALGLFLYWEREEKDTIRERKDKLKEKIEKKDTLENTIKKIKEKIENIKKKKGKKIEAIRDLLYVVEDIEKERNEKRKKRELKGDILGSYNISDRESEISILKDIKNRLDVYRIISNLKEELFDQMQETQETRKEELRSLLREELPEITDQRISPETIESLREESAEKTKQRVSSEAIEKLSQNIEILSSRLENREALEDEAGNDEYMRLPIAELQEKSSPLPLKPGKQETSDTENSDNQNGSLGLPAKALLNSTKALLNSVDRTELRDHVKDEISEIEQEEQVEVPKRDTQTAATDSISEEGISEDEAKEPEQEVSPPKVDSDFGSVFDKCTTLLSQYNFEEDDPEKLSIVQRIYTLVKKAKNEHKERILNSEDAARSVARIFSQAWDPECPEKSLEVLNEVISETESKWNFHYSPGGESHSYKDLRREVENKRRPIANIALPKIDEAMENENFQKNETKTITPGIEWEGRGEGQELSYREIRYQANYDAFKKVRSG